MTLDDIPLFSMLKSRLGYLSERQRLIAQNVANTDTPGYAPQDLKPFTVPSAAAGGAGGGTLALAPVQTNPAHLSGSQASAGGGAQTWSPQTTADSETRLDGNKVVLEEEMMKMTDARTNYDTAIGFYEKSMSMLELAIRTPGKGA
jgi:flagellar basal-body rod protein FlgB